MSHGDITFNEAAIRRSLGLHATGSDEQVRGFTEMLNDAASTVTVQLSYTEDGEQELTWADSDEEVARLLATYAPPPATSARRTDPRPGRARAR